MVLNVHEQTNAEGIYWVTKYIQMEPFGLVLIPNYFSDFAKKKERPAFALIYFYNNHYNNIRRPVE